MNFLGTNFCVRYINVIISLKELVVIVNREGNKVTLAVSKQSITPDQNTPSTAIAMSRSLSNSVTTVSAAGM
jgi:hypothetical protein